MKQTHITTNSDPTFPHHVQIHHTQRLSDFLQNALRKAVGSVVKGSNLSSGGGWWVEIVGAMGTMGSTMESGGVVAARLGVGERDSGERKVGKRDNKKI